MRDFQRLVYELVEGKELNEDGSKGNVAMSGAQELRDHYKFLSEDAIDFIYEVVSKTEAASRLLKVCSNKTTQSILR